jgi:hypothetical protein
MTRRAASSNAGSRTVAQTTGEGVVYTSAETRARGEGQARTGLGRHVGVSRVWQAGTHGLSADQKVGATRLKLHDPAVEDS